MDVGGIEPTIEDTLLRRLRGHRHGLIDTKVVEDVMIHDVGVL